MRHHQRNLVSNFSYKSVKRLDTYLKRLGPTYIAIAYVLYKLNSGYHSHIFFNFFQIYIFQL